MTSDLQALGASALCKGASHRTSVIQRCGGGRGASGGRWHSCGSRGSHGAATAAPTRGGVRALRGGDTYAWRALASGWSAARRRRSPRPAGRGPERAPCEARWGHTRPHGRPAPGAAEPSPGPAWGATAAARPAHGVCTCGVSRVECVRRRLAVQNAERRGSTPPAIVASPACPPTSPPHPVTLGPASWAAG